MWASRPQKGFHGLAAAGSIVLLVLLVLMNAIAVGMRIYYRKKLRFK